jgi:hypothetical protein
MEFLAGCIVGAAGMFFAFYYTYDWYNAYEGPGIRLVAVKRTNKSLPEEKK